jgi:hypothetical protein
LRMRELENQRDMIARWNGVSPRTVVGSSKSGVLLQIPDEGGEK